MQASSPDGLPAVDTASQAHSDRCASYLRERIEAEGGSLGFSEFMHHALYAPGLGYYAAGSTKLGADGDFITAPEVSPLFGRIIARQCADAIEALDDACILELGAGSGRLAIDVLGKLAELDRLPVEYRILEVSADLAERQRRALADALPELIDRVRWVPELPSEHRGIVLANEVLDALPVERFVRRETVKRLSVAMDGDDFKFVETKAPPVLAAAVAAIENELGTPLEEGYTSEVSLAAPAFVHDVLAAMDEGVALFFDYGLAMREYYAAERSNGTLRCHFRHHVHDDPLVLPGIQDITAWVDFTSIASAGIDAGCQIAGYANQAGFLLHGGLDEEFERPADAAERVELSRQAKMLTLPGEMGEYFKCLGLMKGSVPPPPALVAADRTHTL